ncbi:dipeptidase [Palaeococcus ferrophilus]|uniref:dipeptidase n=1 Tax=Palaeococcus ferrophilus TaxID=83868 RepID=UPI00064F4125|nr:dipeptidase [Palaeococcus ferrophilus]
MIFDAHSDLPTYVYMRRGRGETAVLERNFERFFKGIGSRVMAVWTPEDRRGNALRYALDVYARFRRDVMESQRLELVTSSRGMEEAIKGGRVALWFGLEGGEPLESVEVLEVFYSLGLRVLTLTWSLRNAIGDGVFERTNGGLTNFGVEVVGKAEELGVLVDLSHINEAGFWDALDVTSFPVMASHSNARKLCDSPRNLMDEQIKAIAERGGVVGAVAIPSFVKKEDPTLEDYVRHIEYMVDLAGSRAVGLGFDFVYYLEGWSGRAVEGFENEGAIPALLEALRERFSERDVERVTFGNFERLFREVVG